MTNKEIEIDSVLIDLELSAKKAKVIIEDLTQDYFNKRAVDPDDVWEITGVYYEEAGVKARIVNDYLCEVLEEISSLQKLALEQERTAV